MYISMKTYSKKFLVTFFFSMLPMLLMSCSMDPEKASFSISGNLEKLQIGNDGFTEVYSIKSKTRRISLGLPSHRPKEVETEL